MKLSISLNLWAKFTHCFYEMSKELLDVRTKSTRSCNRYFLSISYIYGFLRCLFVVYVMYIDYKVSDWYNFQKYDVLVDFLHTFSDTFEYNILLMVNFFIFIFFLLEWWCYKLNVRGRNWRFWYQLTVESLDLYYKYRLTGKKLMKIQKLKMAKYEKRLSQFKLISVSGVHYVSQALASAEIVVRMEDVDVVAMQNKPLLLMPLLSWRLRSKALKIILFTEYSACALQALIGNFLFNFYFKFICIKLSY